MQALKGLATMPLSKGLCVAGKQTYSEADWPGRSAQEMPLGGLDQSYSEAEFLAQLGERVRASRLLCDLSRRELGRRSGISERYIAQIEAGKGNVSIVLLLRLASAIHGSQPQAA